MRCPARCRRCPSTTLCPLADHDCHERHAASLGAQLPQLQNEGGDVQHLSGLAATESGVTRRVPHREGCACRSCSGTDPPCPRQSYKGSHPCCSALLCSSFPVGKIPELLLEPRKLPGQVPADSLLAGSAPLLPLPAHARSYESPVRGFTDDHGLYRKSKEPGTLQPGCLPSSTSQSSSGVPAAGAQLGALSRALPPDKGLCPFFAPALPSPRPALPPLNPSSLLLLSPRTGTALQIAGLYMSHSSRSTSQSWDSCWVTSAFSVVANMPPEFQLQMLFIASMHLSNAIEVREDGLGSISALPCLLVVSCSWALLSLETVESASSLGSFTLQSSFILPKLPLVPSTHHL